MKDSTSKMLMQILQMLHQLMLMFQQMIGNWNAAGIRRMNSLINSN